MASRTKVLFVHEGEDWIRGSERCMLDLAAALNVKGWPTEIACNASTVLAAAVSEGIPTRQMTSSTRRGAFPHLSELREWRRCVRDSRPALIHVNSVNALPPVLVAAIAQKIPVLVHQHIVDDAFSRLYSWMHQASAIVTISERAQSALLDDGYPADRLFRISNGVRRFADGSTTSLRALIGIEADTTMVVSVGSLIARKGHDRVIRAMRPAVDRLPSLHLALIGSGDAEIQLRELVSTLNLADNVHFVGQRDDVQPLLRSADALVTGAREEVQPLSIIEAMLSGLPVIASSIDAHAEMVEHEVTGLLADADDVDAFTTALIRIGIDRAWRERAGRAARATGTNRYDFAQYVARFERVYDSLLAKPRHAYAVPAALRWMPGYRDWIWSRMQRRLLGRSRIEHRS